MLELGSVKPSHPFSMKKRDLSWRLSPVGASLLALEGRNCFGGRLAAGVIAFCSLTSALASENKGQSVSMGTDMNVYT